MRDEIDDIIAKSRIARIAIDPVRDSETYIGINENNVRTFKFFRCAHQELTQIFENDGKTVKSHLEKRDGKIFSCSKKYDDGTRIVMRFKDDHITQKRVLYPSGKTKSVAKYARNNYLKHYQHFDENKPQNNTLIISRKTGQDFHGVSYKDGWIQESLTPEHRDIYINVTNTEPKQKKWRQNGYKGQNFDKDRKFHHKLALTGS